MDAQNAKSQEAKSTVSADKSTQGSASAMTEADVAKEDFTPFTGKVTRSKVRLRLQPTLDGVIVREIEKDDLVIVQGETEDFYAISAPKDLKGYIFRTLVLDSIVEGNHVNIRLEPSLDAPVIAQLNNGDKVDGSLSALSNKWLEIELPSSARLFVSKDFIEKVGDVQMLAKLEKRRNELNKLLREAYQQSCEQMNLPFEKIDISNSTAALKNIIDNYKDFPDQVSKAQEIVTALQDQYQKRKILYLEEQNENKNQLLKSRSEKIQAAQAGKLEERGNEPDHKSHVPAVSMSLSETAKGQQMTAQMALWQGAEEAFHRYWQEESGKTGSLESQYEEERQQAHQLTGVIQPYLREVKNRPGDYMLYNSSNRPVAYLYSTRVDMAQLLGRQVTILVTPRPNNKFALPAYFVLELQ